MFGRIGAQPTLGGSILRRLPMLARPMLVIVEHRYDIAVLGHGVQRMLIGSETMHRAMFSQRLMMRVGICADFTAEWIIMRSKFGIIHGVTSTRVRAAYRSASIAFASRREIL